MRYERKFVTKDIDLKEVEHLIKHHPLILSEIFKERVVNNIYFDSPDFNNYHSHINGDSSRVKIRIRWYGKTLGLIKKPILELKIKDNELGEKKHFKLNSFVLNKKVPKDLFRNLFLNSNLPDWLINKLKTVQPSLLNSYKRRYFISSDKKYRLTLDWDLVFLNIDNRIYEKCLDEDIVLEVKYELKDYDGEYSITKYLPLRLVAHSKYVKGIQLISRQN